MTSERRVMSGRLWVVEALQVLHRHLVPLADAIPILASCAAQKHHNVDDFGQPALNTLSEHVEGFITPTRST